MNFLLHLLFILHLFRIDMFASIPIPLPFHCICLWLCLKTATAFTIYSFQFLWIYHCCFVVWIFVVWIFVSFSFLHVCSIEYKNGYKYTSSLISFHPLSIFFIFQKRGSERKRRKCSLSHPFSCFEYTFNYNSTWLLLLDKIGILEEGWESWNVKFASRKNGGRKPQLKLKFQVSEFWEGEKLKHDLKNGKKLSR